MEFAKELSLLYSLCEDENREKHKEVGEGFPAGFEYRWNDGRAARPIRCSSPDYIDIWIADNITNEEVFPILETDPFPGDFLES